MKKKEKVLLIAAIVNLSISGAYIFLTVLYLIILLLFENFGSTTITEAAVSPGEEYVAVAVDHNQGALGGCTDVLICKYDGVLPTDEKYLNKHDNYWVYCGRWALDTDIQWINEDTLRYNTNDGVDQTQIDSHIGKWLRD